MLGERGMNVKKQLAGIALGFLFTTILIYILFDFFSWSISLGYLLGIIVFAMILLVLKRI